MRVFSLLICIFIDHVTVSQKKIIAGQHLQRQNIKILEFANSEDLAKVAHHEPLRLDLRWVLSSL